MLNAHSKGKRDFPGHRCLVALIRTEIIDLGPGGSCSRPVHYWANCFW